MMKSGPQLREVKHKTTDFILLPFKYQVPQTLLMQVILTHASSRTEVRGTDNVSTDYSHEYCFAGLEPWHAQCTAYDRAVIWLNWYIFLLH